MTIKRMRHCLPKGKLLAIFGSCLRLHSRHHVYWRIVTSPCLNGSKPLNFLNLFKNVCTGGIHKISIYRRLRKEPFFIPFALAFYLALGSCPHEIICVYKNMNAHNNTLDRHQEIKFYNDSLKELRYLMMSSFKKFILRGQGESLRLRLKWRLWN